MLLNTEVAVRKEPKQKESYDMARAVHHNIIAQPDFQFMSAGGKLKQISDYQTLRQQLHVTRMIKDRLNNVGWQD